MKKHIREFSSLHFNGFLEVLKEMLANGSTIKLRGVVLRSRFIHSFPWPLFSIVIVAVAALVYEQEAARSQFL
jgi:hypothetical protein